MSDEQALLEAATNLSLEFRERSDEIEAGRRVPEDVSRLMAEAGFYRMGTPRCIGGLETPPQVSSQVFELLAQGDSSCAWVAFIGVTSATALAAIPESSARELASDPRTLFAGVATPAGRADRVDGGFRVSGRWQWGSGTQNAQWIIGGCMLYEGGEVMRDRRGTPRSAMVFLSAGDVSFEDTWHVSGLCGTGSLHYNVKDVFVPDDRIVGFVREGRPPATPLYKFPTATFLSLGIGAVCMGIARAAIEELVELAVSKARLGSVKSIAQQQVSQIKLAQAEADLRSARALFYDTLDEAWEAALSTGEVGLDLRRDLRLAVTNAAVRSVGVVGEMYDLGGGSSVYVTSRLQRHLRDINVAKSHIMVSPSTLETIGGLLFGVDVDTAML